MRILRKAIAIAALVAMAAAGGYLYAQTEGEDEPADDVAEPSDPDEKLTPKEMVEKADEMLEDMKALLKRVLGLQSAARKQKDIIKLNCVNDKLLQLKRLINIADEARTNLTEAITLENEDERYHQYGQIKIAHEKAMALREEAEACIGEELVFLGPTEVDVDEPDVPDDPTQDDPFNFTDPEIERPGYASPFL